MRADRGRGALPLALSLLLTVPSVADALFL